MERLVLIGGFTEGRTSLEAVGQAACTEQLVRDFDAFTMAEAVNNPDIIKKASAGVILATHSAGLMAVEHDMSPDVLVAFCAPEPKSPFQLAMSAIKKTKDHLADLSHRPEFRPEIGRVLAGNIAEASRHPLFYPRALGQIARFSASEHIANFTLAENGTRMVGKADARLDQFKFAKNNHDYLNQLGVELAIIDGGHDEIFLRTETVAETIIEMIS